MIDLEWPNIGGVGKERRVYGRGVETYTDHTKFVLPHIECGQLPLPNYRDWPFSTVYRNSQLSKYGCFKYLSKFLYVSATLAQLGLARMAKERENAKQTLLCWKIVFTCAKGLITSPATHSTSHSHLASQTLYLTATLWEVISAKIKVVVFPRGGSSNLDKWIGVSTRGYTNQLNWVQKSEMEGRVNKRVQKSEVEGRGNKLVQKSEVEGRGNKWGTLMIQLRVD